MPRFIMLAGLPGSGKSTYAANMIASNPGWVHLSSDRIARNNFDLTQPINHQAVFSEMYHQTVTALEAGLNVIYDATNLSSKKRRSFLNRIQQQQAETEAIVFLTPYNLLKERNQQREDIDRVPDHIVERYIKSFQFPKRDEKFDKITVLYERTLALEPISSIRRLMSEQRITYDEFLGIYQTFEETKPLLELEPVTRRAYLLFHALREKAQNTAERELYFWVSALYCIGKFYVQKNMPLEEDNFYGYEHVSWYLAYPILSLFHFPDSFIFDALLLIDEHVEARTSKSGRIRRKIGIENFERMQHLLEAMERTNIDV